MEKKVWHKVSISTEYQEIEVCPTEFWDGITISTKEKDDNETGLLTYLDEASMELLISKMREMMSYVKQK